MTPPIHPGAVIFTTNHARLAAFYAALTGMTVHGADEHHTVVRSSSFELVLHALRGPHDEPNELTAREDGYIKLLFPVPSLATAREQAPTLGGRVYSVDKEWEARGFRACDGLDPDGNVVQFREAIAS